MSITATEKHLHYIGGQWIPSTNQNQNIGIDRKMLVKKNPWNLDESIAEIDRADVMNVVSSLSSTKSAMQIFSKWNLEQKISFFKNLQQLISQNVDSIAHRESLAQGLPLQFVRDNGVLWVVSYLESYIEELELIINSQNTFLCPPVGIVSIISSWQLGFRLIAERLIPALVTGNCVTIKTSLHSTVSGQIWSELISKTELPPGTVQILHGGDDLALMLMQHPSFKSICFVGRTAIAESIWNQLPLFSKKYSFSLSTRNPLVILPGASEESIQKSLMAFAIGRGELCWNVGRIFCVDADKDKVIELVKSEWQRINWNQKDPNLSEVGVHLGDDLIIGETGKQFTTSLANDLRQTIVQEQGRVLLGGEKNIPIFAVDLPNCSFLQQDPVALLNLTTVKYTYEIAKWINTGYLAHSAIVLGDNEKKEKFSRTLEIHHIWQKGWMESEDKRFLVHGNKQTYLGERINSLQSPLWVFPHS